MKKQLSELIAALTAEDPSDFVQTVQNHIYRKQGYDIEELIQCAPRKDLVTIGEGLKHQAEIGVALFTTDHQPEEQDPTGEDEEEEITPQELGCGIMMGVAIVSRIVFAQTKPSPPEDLLAAATLLHDHLLAARDYPDLQDEISKLLLEWWQSEGPKKYVLTLQTMPCLVGAALRSGTAAAVKRCHGMRTAMELFDFDDPSISDLKGLLLRAAFAPCFLRSSEGRRFLAYLFTLQPSFVRELTAIVKNQIPAGRRSVLDAYGEIIYRAWSTAMGACLLEIKHTCIQDLMESAILASTPALASALRRVLGGLHCQKHQPGVDAMLLELYEPILFRRLNAANPAVRRNALELFFDAFPLRDPEEPSEAMDSRMTDQFAVLTAALKDDVPAVRAVAVAGVGRILGAYWELIPAGVTAGYLKMLATELAFDGASPAVRAAVSESLAALVDCPLSHPILAVVLPKLAPQLYDPSMKVRITFVELLMSLRGIKDLSWNAIVDLQKLLEAMAVDVPAVSGRIQRLLLPIYFPDAHMGPSLVASLLRSSPEAGRAFCLYLAGAHMPAQGGVAAAKTTAAGPAVAQHCLLTLIKDLSTHLSEVPLVVEEPLAGPAADAGAGAKGGKKGRSKRKKAQPAEADGEEKEEDAPILETEKSWESILGGLTAVCCGLAAQMAAGGLESTTYKGLFPADTFSKLLERCSSATARQELATIAAALPLIPGAADVRTSCVAFLSSEGSTSAAADGRSGGEVRAALDCVGAHPASRAALVKAMATAFGADPEEVWASAEDEAIEPPQRGKRRKFEKYSFEGDLSQAAVITYLAAMLELDGPRNFLLSSGVLGRLLPWIDGALGALVEELTTAIDAGAEVEDLGTRADISTVMVTYMKSCVHLLMAGQPGTDGAAMLEGAAGEAARGQATECLQQTMQWTTQLLQRIEAAEPGSLMAALAPQVPQVQPTKRSRGAKGKSAAAGAAPALSPASVALKEALAAIHTCVAVAGEAALLRALDGQGSGVSWAPAAARVGQMYVTVLRNLVAAAVTAKDLKARSSRPSSDVEWDVLDVMVLSGVSHVARMARNLAASAKATPAAPDGARDLRSELAQAAAPSPAATETAGSDSVGPLMEGLMSLMCEDADGVVISSLKTMVPGLVATMCCTGNSGGDGAWLAPVASFLASGIDYEKEGATDFPVDDAQNDENAHDGANKQVSGATGIKAAAIASAELLSEKVDAPLIKHLVAAVKLVKASGVAAAQAAGVAARAWSLGDGAATLGAVELIQLFGFAGVTSRGKNKVAGFNFETAIKRLQKMQEAVQERDTTSGAAAMVASKLQALLPSAPRVSFGHLVN